MNVRQNVAEGVNIIKSLGYDCYFPVFSSSHNDEVTYCYFTDGTKIGYMQSDVYGITLEFSTVHKPNKRNGTGFGVANRVVNEDINKELIEKCFKGPEWADKSVPKYKSWIDYEINSLTGQLCDDWIKL